MRLNRPLARRQFPVLTVTLAMAGLLFLSACSNSSGGPTGGSPSSSGQSGQPPAQTSQAPSSAAPKSAAPSQAPSSGAPESAAASSQPTLNACSLLTKAEVEAAIGTPVLEPKRDEDDQRASCLFNDPKAPSSALVRIDVITYNTVGGAKLGYETGKGLAVSAAEGQIVSGLGDDAYWAGESGVSTLGILKSKYEIRLRVLSGETSNRRNMAQELAAKALGRLPQ